jgi:hypothetical protein
LTENRTRNGLSRSIFPAAYLTAPFGPINHTLSIALFPGPGLAFLLVKSPRPISEATLGGIKLLVSHREKEALTFEAIPKSRQVNPGQEVSHSQEHLANESFSRVPVPGYIKGVELPRSRKKDTTARKWYVGRFAAVERLIPTATGTATSTEEKSQLSEVDNLLEIESLR